MELEKAIFEFAQYKIDEIIEQNGFYDDTSTNNLEDLIIDTRETILLANNIKDDLNLNNFEDYEKIINLTSDFLNWLFNNGNYDKKFYQEHNIIALTNKV